jgi:hypothetical protein
VNSPNVVLCAECREPIDPKEEVSFARFKVPGTEDYHYFHWRIRGSDCWESHLKAQVVPGTRLYSSAIRARSSRICRG